METINFNLLNGKVGILLCTSGSRQVLVNGQFYHIKKGMVCFHSPLISIYELSRDDAYEELSISDDIEVFYPVFKTFYDLIIGLSLPNKPCILLDEKHINLFRQRCSLIESEKREFPTLQDKGEKLLSRHIIQLLERETILEFLRFFWKSRAVKFEPAKKKETITFRFIYSLLVHCKTQRHVDFYAREINLSQGHFTRIIKEQTGKTPAQWIAEMTIIDAKLLLAQSDKSIKEVAAELHFPEQFTFRKFFKTHVGLSPKDYRLRNRQKNADDTPRAD